MLFYLLRGVLAAKAVPGDLIAMVVQFFIPKQAPEHVTLNSIKQSMEKDVTNMVAVVDTLMWFQATETLRKIDMGMATGVAWSIAHPWVVVFEQFYNLPEWNIPPEFNKRLEEYCKTRLEGKHFNPTYGICRHCQGYLAYFECISCGWLLSCPCGGAYRLYNGGICCTTCSSMPVSPAEQHVLFKHTQWGLEHFCAARPFRTHTTIASSLKRNSARLCFTIRNGVLQLTCKQLCRTQDILGGILALHSSG
eukprot:TRINITY_DN12676_c0_g2_i1.p1 TRINITY_DN12676_c0_g2~~TRINITY_DN12676_c0_g2_i1.p1  ORF type:complete len:250 (+),score=33.34 TRINITY_DN12676_c0_g2_i1:55-804(+)